MIIYLFYLGFLTRLTASLSEASSRQQKTLKILWRSRWTRAGSASKAASDASMSGLNSRGQGPAVRSPSNRVDDSSQDPSRTVGMLSLHRKFSVVLDFILFKN